MKSFNSGRGSNPSDEVVNGKLRGMTDESGHLHFLCPRCADNQILQILDYKIDRDGPVEYNPAIRPKAKRDFKIVFHLHCLECKLTDFVEISNDGWQGGKITSSRAFEGTSIYSD